ncbi:CoA pyrophosphatase [Thalassotalea ganghwensis]
MNSSIDKASFIRQFTLSNALTNSVSFNVELINLKPSAVLVPIIELDNQLQFVLTKRASHLKHHAGQISFPGGKVEQSDRNIIETALRETEEEIGISSKDINVLGTLPFYQTLTGFKITPVLAFINQAVDYKLDPNEVAEVFQVPLSHFMNNENHFSVEVFHRNKYQHVHYLPYKQYNIWGATAAIIKGLVHQLSENPLQRGN